MSWHRKGKTNLDLLEQEIVSGSGISWAICKSALGTRRITMPASHHSAFYRLDALPAIQPTASKHWRQKLRHRTGEKLPTQIESVQWLTSTSHTRNLLLKMSQQRTWTLLYFRHAPSITVNSSISHLPRLLKSTSNYIIITFGRSIKMWFVHTTV